MKKHKYLLAVAALSVGVLTACGDNEEVTNAPNDAPTEQSNGAATETPANAPFNFTQFSVDADYGGNKNIEASYDNESTGVEASYENDLTSEKLNGNDAFSKLEPMFEGFTFDVNTPNDQVIQQVKDAFTIGEDYRELEIDVKFADGSEKEYRDMK